MRGALIALVASALLAAGVAAYLSFRNRGNDFVPSVVVRAQHGLSVAEAETTVAQPLERALLGMAGVTALHTHVGPQAVEVRVDLLPGPELEANVLEVLQRVGKAELPAGVTPETTSSREPTQRAYLALDDKTRAVSELQALAWKGVALPLLQTPGYRDVTPCGPGEPGLRITLDPAKLPEGPAGVLRALERSAVGSVPQGIVVQGQLTREELEQLDLGGGLHLRDVATLSERPDGPPCIARHKGPVLGLLVRHTPAADSGVLSRAFVGLPPGVHPSMLRVDRVLHFAAPNAGPEVADQLEASLRQVPGVEDAAIELSPRGEATTGTAYVQVNRNTRRLRVDKVQLPPGVALTGVEGAGVIDLVVTGPDLDVLGPLADKIRDEVAHLGPVATSRAPTSAALRLSPDRTRLADLGLSSADLADALRLASEDGVELPVHLKQGTGPGPRVSVGAGKLEPEQLLALPIGKGVTLGSVARLEREAGPAWIDREDGQRAVHLEVAARSVEALEAAGKVQLPVGYAVRAVVVP